ncbi:MAG: hypothetical protein KME30_30685 [Iphinoe sp. HA4291-MV1]|nr:hypothetical protein [Iphinoe sp. HA4291-MV1]
MNTWYLASPLWRLREISSLSATDSPVGQRLLHWLPFLQIILSATVLGYKVFYQNILL